MATINWPPEKTIKYKFKEFEKNKINEAEEKVINCNKESTKGQHENGEMEI